MRKSVTIGFGLWLLAVVTVAVVASVAIQTAGRQVTSVEITAALPDTSPSPSSARDPEGLDPSDLGGAAVIDPSAVKVAATIPGRRTAARPTRDDATSYFGTYGTDGGRLRVRCTGPAVSLDGGYARPEPGWSGRVDTPHSGMILVLFWNRARAITVAAECSGGRPDFRERAFLLRNGVLPPPQPAEPVPTPNMLLAPAPPPPAQPQVQPAPAQPMPAQPTVSAQATAPGPSGPSGPSASSVDPAQVTAYVQAQDDMCAQAQWANDWCRSWGSLSDEQQFLMVWRWLLSVVSSPPVAASDSPQAS